MRERIHVIEVNESELRLLQQCLRATRLQVEAIIDTFPGVHSVLGDKTVAITKINQLLIKVQQAPRENRYLPDLIPALLIFDADHRVLVWGSQATKLLGWHDDEILGFDLFAAGVLDEAQAEQLNNYLDEIVQSDDWALFTIKARHREGQIIKVRMRTMMVELNEKDHFAAQMWDLSPNQD